jgi:integrase/recombinase XerD
MSDDDALLPVPGPPVVQGARTLTDLVPVFLRQFRIVRQRSEATIRGYQSDLAVFLGFCERADLHYPAQVRVQHLEVFLGWLSETRGLQASTVARYRYSLMALWEWLEHEELAERNPAAKTYAPKQRKRLTRALSIAQQDRLFTALACDLRPVGIRDYAIHGLLGYAGLRASEVSKLCLAHLDLESKALYVVEGKGGKDRPVSLLTPLDGILERYLTEARPRLLRGEEYEHVFFRVARGKGPLGSRGVWNLVHRTLERVLGVADGHPHMLRHSLGFRLHEHGASMRDIQDMLGHENISTTQRYVRTVTASQRERLSRLLERTNGDALG